MISCGTYARKYNEFTGHKGHVWQKSFHDRIIRGPRHIRKTIVSHAQQSGPRRSDGHAGTVPFLKLLAPSGPPRRRPHNRRLVRVMDVFFMNDTRKQTKPTFKGRLRGILEKILTQRLDVHERAIVRVLEQIMHLLNPPPLPVPPGKKMGF